MLTAHTRTIVPGVTCVTWGLHDKPAEAEGPLTPTEAAEERMEALITRERFEALERREIAYSRRSVKRASKRSTK